MDIAPKSLFNRFLLIIVLPIVILQIITAYIFYERHWQSVSQKMCDALIAEINVMNQLIESNSSSGILKAVAQKLHIDFQLFEDKQIEFFAKNHPLKTSVRFAELWSDLQNHFPNSIYSVSDNGEVKLYISTTKGVVVYGFSSKRVLSPTTWIFIMWMIGSSLLLLVAVLFMKNQVRPILTLAAVAEEFGKGREVGVYKPSGASEIRKVGDAFINMKKRIYRQINYRTELLNHISHDLRTPLTRLKLRSVMLADAESKKFILGEIDYMSNMVNSYLNFAKEEGNEETLPHNIALLTRELIAGYKNHKIEFICRNQKITLKFRRDSMRRALLNLVDNAVKYSRKKIRITMKKTAENVVLVFEDDGSGIPKRHYKDVFKPFFKLDRKSESFGLGLSSVKSIIYSHGGSIKLAKSTLGGLKTIIKIPY